MTSEPVIVVIDGSEERSRNLKELIEFMDVPRVRIANVDNWRDRLGERRLAAIFVGDDLEPAAVDRVIREVGDFDPNTPIVRVAGSHRQADSRQESETNA